MVSESDASQSAEEQPNQDHLSDKIGRLGFLRNVFLVGGLAGAYGLAAGFALRYLLPSRGVRKSRMFIAGKSEVRPGDSRAFVTPDGETFLLTNTGDGVQPYIAFSSRCPHLGCKVHWEDENKRFFCPCHGGAFNPAGQATEGPPAKEKQNLKSCEILVEGEAIYAVLEHS